MQKDPDCHQQKFIEHIKRSLPANVSLVNELSDLLKISADSAYRRLRNETSFSLDEIINICDHYKISFDSFCNYENGIVNFNYSLMQNDVQSIRNYVSNIRDGLERIYKFDEKEIIYTAEDIPVFHLFKHIELASFKLFYWMKSVLNITEYKDKIYDPGFIDQDILETGERIIFLYSRIPSIELWNDRTISSILKQIDYYFESGLFSSKETALRLCDILKEVLNDIQKQAERSSKANVAGFEGNFTMYNSDIELGNNCILANTPASKTVYLRHHTFNNMQTSDTAFCNETELWLKGLIKKSTLISGVSEKQRYQFFRNAYDEIDRLKERIG